MTPGNHLKRCREEEPIKAAEDNSVVALDRSAGKSAGPQAKCLVRDAGTAKSGRSPEPIKVLHGVGPLKDFSSLKQA
eukprot:scaffold678922_cov43-Prasinocladus_malaysianus.AAC.1